MADSHDSAGKGGSLGIEGEVTFESIEVRPLREPVR
jgi:hypothetical protein